MHLTSKTLVDKIMATSPFITIGSQRIQVRRLITPSIRLVISNVCPTIPHQNKIQALQQQTTREITSTASPLNEESSEITDINTTMQKKRTIENEEENLSQSNEDLPHTPAETITTRKSSNQSIKPKTKKLNRSASPQEKVSIEIMIEPIKKEINRDPEKYPIIFE